MDLATAARPARHRPLAGRLLRAVLVFRLELRPLAPLEASFVLLAWLRRPVIQMPARVQAAATAGERLRSRLDEVYPF